MRIGPKSAGMLMTPKQFDAIKRYDERYRYELIRGALIVTPIASAGETNPNEELGVLLRNYRRQHPQGKKLDLTLPQQYVRTRTSRRLADRLIWTGLGRAPNLEKDLPSIAVEFVSASRRDWERDYVVKRREYSKLGIPEYWIVDRFRRIMTVILTERGKQREIVVHENETYRTPRLPGFELPLRELFAAVDEVKQPK
jgi:Uma2 family endonuclease